MTTYSDTAYDDDTIGDALFAEGFKRDDFQLCIAQFTTEGLTLTDIAKRLGLIPSRFWAYYQVWCLINAEPLRLGVSDE